MLVRAHSARAVGQLVTAVLPSWAMSGVGAFSRGGNPAGSGDDHVFMPREFENVVLHCDPGFIIAGLPR